MIKSNSALAGIQSVEGWDELQLQEVRNRGLWQIDCWASSEAKVREQLSQLTGLVLSDQAGAVVADGERRLMWAGPARFWWVAEQDGDVAQQLESQLAADDGHVMDIGHSRTVIRLQGSKAQTILQSGIAVDMDEDEFKPGRVILTGLTHHTPVTLHRIDEQCFELYVARSYARHTLEWLMAAGKPYKVSWKATLPN